MLKHLANSPNFSTSNGGLLVGVAIVVLLLWLVNDFQKTSAEVGRKSAGGMMLIAILIVAFIVKMGHL